MKMKTLEVSFIWNGKVYREIVETTNSARARELIQGRYDGAKITHIREVK